jgi:hypothetical protein
MISVILYGRNDDYGYNLHKRASLSLNCLARVLSYPHDEIIFVDYNTPDDFPTFPEAIRDTLTPEAQRLLRILRVRSTIHARFQTLTHLPALEPIARNIGIRRSDPNNRWILSTNTDMILVPTEDLSLSGIASSLSRGFYHVPRYDVPESLWETLDRMNPDAVIEVMKELGETTHLNEMIFGADHILYDGPGDFQLVEREEMFAIQGFCEGMLLGWHVDSNLSKRLYLRHGHVGDLAGRIRAYHCEHTRSYSAMHYVGKSNDVAHFVDDITTETIREQADSWGCPGDDIEEIKLTSCASTVYLHALKQVIGGEQVSPPEVLFTPETFNVVTYDTKHVLPYLADVFVNLPRGWSIGWLGGRVKTLDLFASIWEKLGFQGKILLDGEISAMTPSHQANERRSWNALADEADAFVFDFGDLECGSGIDGLEGGAQARAANLVGRFFSLMSIERCRHELNGFARRRIIFVNAIHNDFEKLSLEFLDTVRTPLSSRVRQGFVSLREAKCNWLARQLVGVAGMRGDEGVHMRAQPGHVIYGPYVILPPGQYRATVAIQGELGRDSASKDSPLVVEIVSGGNFIAQRDIRWDELKEGRHILEFEVTTEMANSGQAFRTELRVWTSGDVSASITAVEVKKLIDGSEERQIWAAQPTVKIDSPSRIPMDRGAKMD